MPCLVKFDINMAAIILEAQSISKRYDQLQVLKDVSIQIQEGTFNTIVGPSGAGKSTLLQLLSGLDATDKGNILLKGEAIAGLNADRLAKIRNQHFGFVFQFHHLLPEFTALENVAMPLLIAKVNPKDAYLKATKELEKVGLSHRLEHKPSELSGGEQQRVAVARALVNNPAIIFADEPTGNLDTANAKAVHELFLKLQQEHGQTLIIVTHNEQLSQLGDYCYHMRDGKIEHIISHNS